MLTRWTFYFEQGSINSDVTNLEEDERIGGFIQENPKGLLLLKGVNTDIFVNLDRVKCIACQMITQEQLDLEKSKQLESANVQAPPQESVPA